MTLALWWLSLLVNFLSNWNRVTRFSLKTHFSYKIQHYIQLNAMQRTKLSVRHMLYSFFKKKMINFVYTKNNFSSNYTLFKIPLYNRAPKQWKSGLSGHSEHDQYFTVRSVRVDSASVQDCGRATAKASRHSWTCSTRASCLWCVKKTLGEEV